MTLQKVKLKRLSICPCGFTVLRDEITVGTVYEVDLDSVRSGFHFLCGGCGNIIPDLMVINVAQSRIPGEMKPLPFSLFFDPS